jgi:putative ABC transport system permease protein
MNLVILAWRSLLNRRISIALTIITIAFSIALLVVVEQLRQEVRQGFYRSVSGVDLIVGARTAPIQLLLYSVFGIGGATNNIDWQTYEELTQLSEVAWAVPMALGDSHRGYRVMGTSKAFFDAFKVGNQESLTVQSGRAKEALFNDLFDVVIGSQVASQLGYAVGDAIVLSHGTGNVSLQNHDQLPFQVAAVLSPTGTPIDQQLYVSLEAHHALHVGWESGVQRRGAGLGLAEARALREELKPETLTAIFLGLKTRVAVFGLQRRVNEYRVEPLSAIIPGITLQELWRISGLAEQVLRVVAFLVVVTGLLGMLTVLLTTLNERRREMAILRANGARPHQIATLLIWEAGLIAMAGIGVGLVVAYVAQWLAAPFLLDKLGIYLNLNWPTLWQWGILGAIWLAGLLVALIPAFLAYRRTLADGMQVRN